MTDEKVNSSKTSVHPEVIMTIARLTTLKVDGVSRMASSKTSKRKLFKKSFREGVKISINDDNSILADIHVIIKDGFNIRDVGKKIQDEVSRAISEMVGMEIARINVHVEDIDFEGSQPTSE